MSLCDEVDHFFLSPILNVHGFVPVLLSNLLFMAVVSYYHYLNFLGYDGMKNNEVIIGLDEGRWFNSNI
ncbi:hypothetical protein ACS0TY_026462 [Phlomoides rotata]